MPPLTGSKIFLWAYNRNNGFPLHIIITGANIKISTLWSRQRLALLYVCILLLLFWGEERQRDIQSMTKWSGLDVA